MVPRPRTWVFVLATLAVLLLVAVLILRLGPVPAPAPLPNPNGYDDFVKAGAAATGNVGDYNILSNAALRELVSTNAEALRLLRIGLAHQCAVPPDMAITNISGMISDLAGMKRLAQLLAAEGLLHQQDNQPVQAVHTYLDAIRFGNEISRGGVLINRLVGVACEAIGRAPLAKLVPSLTTEQARQVLAQLEKIDSTHVTWDEVCQGESRYARRYLSHNPNPITWVVGLWQNRAAKKRASDRHNSILAQERLLAAELALRCYCADKTSPPAHLEDLVPGYLSKVPQDPFMGQPMIYRPQGTNWVLYSLGPDHVDNGGQPMGRINLPPGDLLYNAP
jgi:hypothetical protein